MSAVHGTPGAGFWGRSTRRGRRRSHGAGTGVAGHRRRPAGRGRTARAVVRRRMAPRVALPGLDGPRRRRASDAAAAERRHGGRGDGPGSRGRRPADPRHGPPAGGASHPAADRRDPRHGGLPASQPGRHAPGDAHRHPGARPGRRCAPRPPAGDARGRGRDGRVPGVGAGPALPREEEDGRIRAHRDRHGVVRRRGSGGPGADRRPSAAAHRPYGRPAAAGGRRTAGLSARLRGTADGGGAG